MKTGQLNHVNLNNDSENLFNALAISVKKLYHAGRVKSVENDRFKIVRNHSTYLSWATMKNTIMT